LTQASSLPRSRKVIIAVLPADSLASIVLTIALVAVLGYPLVAELALRAIAVTGVLTLTFAAGPTAVLVPVDLTLPAEPGLATTLVTRLIFVTLIPVHIPMVMMAMVVMCHLRKPPCQCHRRAMRGSRDPHVLSVRVARAVPWRGARGGQEPSFHSGFLNT